MKKTTESAEQPISSQARTAGKKPKEATAEPARGNLRAQGLRTRNEIVRVARKLLLEAGSLDFTLREVAARAGISISNLQYYFPTRLSVLRAVVEPVVTAYLDDLERAVGSNRPPREALKALLERGFRDAKNAEGTALSWHFVSLAAIDPECSQLLDEWYETVTRKCAQLIRSAYPHVGAADSLHVATLLIAMSDGLSYQLGAGRRKRDYTRGLEARFLSVVEAILGGGPLPTRND